MGFSSKGDRTPKLNRSVKGRKGIGKFAGLILASDMELITQAAGKCTRVLISKTVLMGALGDLEKVLLPLDVTDSDPLDARGTTISLHNLNPKLAHVQPDKLKELHALDYDREPSFVIFVNGKRVLHHDIQSEKFQTKITLPNGQTASVSYTIADKPLSGKNSGLNVRVSGKSIETPHLFGLENNDTLSDKLRRRIVGEINLPAGALELTAAGGEVDPKLVDEYTGKKTKFASYRAIIANAKTQLEWLIAQLQTRSP